MPLPAPGTKAIINTGPLIACAIATDDWRILTSCGLSLSVPTSVWMEIQNGPQGAPGRALQLPPDIPICPIDEIPHHLSQTLDLGEASVIALALQQQAPLVVIDELAGKRMARLHGLQVTGSLGLLVCACRNNPSLHFDACATAMMSGGIHLSQRVLDHARALLHA